MAESVVVGGPGPGSGSGSELEAPKTTLGYLKGKGKAAIDYIGHTKLVNPVRRNVLALKRSLMDDSLDKDTDKETEEEAISQTLIGSIYGILKFIIDVIYGFLTIPYVSEIGFGFFALVFGVMFYSANISYNGNTNKSVFVGYCVFAWIVMFLVLIVICQLIHSFRRQTMIA
jgi:uncharacterized membrane protein YvlD (DUF360 family)